MKFRRRHIVARLARVWGTLRVGPAPVMGAVGGEIDWHAANGLPGPGDGPLFDRFEALGDGCEFASVQRYAGIDRLGLFKWAGVDLQVLIDLLDDGLAGVDDPSRFRLRPELRPAGHTEYMVDHDVLRCAMHSADSFAGLDLAEATARETRRLTLMKRKFLADMTAGRRVYVYASLATRPIEQVGALFDALGRHGPNRLLFVREADETLAAGEIRLLRPGFAEAAIDRLARYEAGATILTKMWAGLIRDADALLASDGETASC